MNNGTCEEGIRVVNPSEETPVLDGDSWCFCPGVMSRVVLNQAALVSCHGLIDHGPLFLSDFPKGKTIFFYVMTNIFALLNSSNGREK